MATIGERLRDPGGLSPDNIRNLLDAADNAADTIDALVAALEEIGRKAKDATTFHNNGTNAGDMFADISVLTKDALALARGGK